MAYIEQNKGRKRQRRKKLPGSVIERLSETFQTSTRTICRRITAGDPEVVAAALTYVHELLEKKKAGRAAIDNLNDLLTALYSVDPLTIKAD